MEKNTKRGFIISPPLNGRERDLNNHNGGEKKKKPGREKKPGIHWVPVKGPEGGKRKFS